MRANRLQENPSKTEVLWCASGRRQHQIPTSPVRTGSTYVLPVSSVRDLGVHMDSDVSLRTHVTATVRSCFAALRQIWSVRRCLPQHALLTLIRVLVVSKVDYRYCCSVLAGVSGHLLDRLQSILNAAARLVFSARRSKRITRFSTTFIGCGSRNRFNSVSAFWHSDVLMDQRRHISPRAFVGQPMWKVVATSALLPP